LRDGSLVQAYRNRAQQRVQKHYDWETVVDQYEQLFARMCGQEIPSEAVPAEAEASSVMKAMP
jgi:hypothetical protein